MRSERYVGTSDTLLGNLAERPALFRASRPLKSRLQPAQLYGTVPKTTAKARLSEDGIRLSAVRLSIRSCFVLAPLGIWIWKSALRKATSAASPLKRSRDPFR